MNGDKFSNSRRRWIKSAAGAAAGAFLVHHFISCKQEVRQFPVKFVLPSHDWGHKLRDPGFKLPDPSETIKTKVAVIGGGIAGLSAGRMLAQQNMKDCLLFELEEECGGNSCSGENEYGRYPWAAHYIPIPNDNFPEYLSFLEEAGVITGKDAANKPVFNEEYLCFEPEERLFMYSIWQEGLIPVQNFPDSETEEIKGFLEMMEAFRKRKGNDGKYAFNIPIEESSEDEAIILFDGISFADYLKLNGFKAPSLLWYLDYCCRDDYGAGIEKVSAWAGIHYFASRKNADTVLTWPEGNAFLAKKLREKFPGNILNGKLVCSVDIAGDDVHTVFLDTKTGKTTRLISEKAIVCLPGHISKRIVKVKSGRDLFNNEQPSCYPWVVANITLKETPVSIGAPMSWDNVIYKGAGLGYVNSSHQALKTAPGPVILTYYRAFCKNAPSAERQYLSSLNEKEVWALIHADLVKAHPGLEELILECEIRIWGHGMICPAPGAIFGSAAKAMRMPVEDKIFFAHSDLSGISIFEEAFYRGNRAAEMVLKSMHA